VTDAQVSVAQRRRVAELAELDRAKTRFFTGVSHELRTPLALIAGPAQDSLLDTDNPLPPVQRSRLELIHRNTGRLRRLVDTLLDFARIEDGGLRPNLVALDLGEVTRGIAESFVPAVRRARLTMSVDCVALGRPMLLDLDMWEKIVLNLLSNAVKFTFDGGIEIGLRMVGDDAYLRVRDSGVGIPADELPLLFQRFHQVQGVAGRSHEGSGIGLALVRELVELHDGDIDVASEVGEGTTFTVRIPARHADGDPTQVARPSVVEPYVDEALQWSPAAEDADPPAVPGADVVLIAEDNTDLRQYLAGLLTPLYRVVLAADGEAALEQARRLRPDLVLTDVMMPRLDGFGLLRALRGDVTTVGIPVIFLSARAGQEAAIEGLDAGADDYLVKPFSSADLLARVRSNLDLARLRNHESAWRTALVNAMQDGFFVSTADGAVIEINEAFTALLGYPADGLPYRAPHPWWPGEQEDPEGHAKASAVLATALANGRGRFVIPLRHRDGRRLWIDVALAALRDRDGTEQLITGTLRDVTVEYLSAERDAALVGLSTRLAAIEDSSRILAVGIAELRSVWHAERVSIVHWDDAGVPHAVATTSDAPPTGSALPAAGAEELTTTGRFVTRTEGNVAVTAIGAPITDGTATVLVWVEFAGPRPFLVSDQTLLTQLCGHLQRALHRARSYEEQRAVALTLQRAILGPTELPAGFAVCYEPAARALEVGGDWYDVVGMSAGRFGVVVGDVVGHSLAAATVMGQLRSAGRTLLLENHTPAQVLEALDRFAALIAGAGSTTVFCAVIDPQGGQVRYSSAGHPPAVLMGSDGVARHLDRALSLPLAVVDGLTRPEETIEMAAGSTLLLYTDGLVERRGEVIDEGIERAVAALAEGRELAPAELVEHLAQRLLDDEHDDDVAFLTYRQPLAQADLWR
jgi:PAS domain S-box-containing protein